MYDAGAAALMEEVEAETLQRSKERSVEVQPQGAAQQESRRPPAPADRAGENAVA